MVRSPTTFKAPSSPALARDPVKRIVGKCSTSKKSSDINSRSCSRLCMSTLFVYTVKSTRVPAGRPGSYDTSPANWLNRPSRSRIAGNVVNDDLIGSLEFACAVSGAKAIVLFGHTACGAIKGAIDDVEMGNLTGLLARIKPAISATKFTDEKSSKNAGYVDAVARMDVLLGLDGIRRRSPILADLEKKGRIQIVGGMYDLATGSLEFLNVG